MVATTPPVLEAIEPEAERGGSTSIWRDTLGNLLRQRNAVIGLIVLTFFILVAVFADVIATHDPDRVLIGVEDGVKKIAAPCIHAFGCPAAEPEHYFGVDGNVRDVYSRVVHGTRISLRIGFVTVGFAIIIGGFIGALAGYAGGKLDNFLMRIMDVLLAFPALLLAIAIVTVLGSGLVNAQLAIGVVAIPIYARIEGIPGGMTVAGLEGTIEVHQLTHKVYLPTDADDGSIAGTRKHSSVVIRKAMDKSSPLLFQKVCTGETIPKVMLTYFEINDMGQEMPYQRITLTKVKIADYHLVNTNTLGWTEEVALRYEKITFEHFEGNIQHTDEWNTR